MPSDLETINGDAAPATVSCNESERIMEGLVLPWGDTGATATGSYTFPRGSLDIPSEIERVKLLSEHSRPGHQPKAIGHAISAENTPEGLVMRFQLGSSAAATEALTNAAEHIIDSFSIEAVGVRRTGGTIDSALLKAVALVPFPAFEKAKVYAESGTPEEKETTEMTLSAEDITAIAAKVTENLSSTTATPRNKIPAGIPGGKDAAKQEVITAAHAAETILGIHTGEIPDDEIQAALADIKGSDSIVTQPKAWLGELWSGVVYQRRIIPLIATKALTGRKAIGFRWKKDTDSGKLLKPGVAKWSGNKTEIPTQKAQWEEVSMDAQPWAGGNDLDRQIFDFNESEALLAYWQAMNESYAYETDRDAGKFLVDHATDIPDVAQDIIRAITIGAIRVDEAVHVPAASAIVNPRDLEKVLKYSQLDVPHYMSLTPVSEPATWTTSEFVESGTAIVGCKDATTFFELPGSPLRAEAEHIAHGGRDVGLFGYTAHMLNRSEGLVKVHFNNA